MLQSQVNRLMNITKQQSYNLNTIYLNEQKGVSFRNRTQQIRNEFDLLDFDQKGYLFRGQIEDYLQKKYQWINKDILNALFDTMDWKRKDINSDLYVQKYHFAFIIHLEINFASSTQPVRDNYFTNIQSYNPSSNGLTLFSIFINGLRIWYIYMFYIYKRPSYYASVQILKLDIYKLREEFINIDVRYENHDQRLEFDINQNCYDPTKPSFQLILPAQQHRFFLSYNFTNTKNHLLLYGNTYIQIDLDEQNNNRILKQQELNLQVRKNGNVVGRCRVLVSLESNAEVIKQKLREKSLTIKENLKQRKGIGLSLGEIKRKEYQYLQFLWGVKHMPPAKIEHQDVMLIVMLRTILIAVLGSLGVIVHVLGRCEPLGLICVFLMLKWRTYVILKSDLFLMLWLIIAALLLDGVWLVFSSHHVSQITYLNFQSSITLTYFLLGVKSLFFIYLLAFQKPFQSEKQHKTDILNDNLS